MTGDPELELVPSRVLVPSLGGFGAQFNQHVYAGITGAPLGSFSDLEQKVLRLRPQLVRLFYNDRQETASRDQLESFVLTVELAQRAGATINVTWQSGGVDKPEASMSRFADVLLYLARRGATNLRWVTIQNEPNSTKITPAQNAAMYRALDRRLAAAGVRDQIRFMGGDLVRAGQAVWFASLAAQLADVLDAYSIHVYWDYGDVAGFQARLREVKAIVGRLPKTGRKPLYVSEYSVRGKPRTGYPQPGAFADGTPIGQTRIAAFQHAWFQIVASSLGYAGTVKWDCYAGSYDRGTQAYYAIGPWQEGWPLYPTYEVLRLVTGTTEPEWRVLGVVRRKPSARTKHLAAFAGPVGELTILGLDAAGGRVDGVTSTEVRYTIGGLPSRASLSLVVWNGTGDGRNKVVGRVAADDAGAVAVAVPLHAVFALTTKPFPDR